MSTEISNLSLQKNIIIVLKQNNIQAIEHLEALCKNNQLRNFTGIGYASERKIDKAIIKYKKAQKNLSYLETRTSINCISIKNDDLEIPPEIKCLAIPLQQQKIMSLLITGFSLKAVCEKLGVSDRTLRYHLMNLKLTYNAKSLPQLVYKALRESISGEH